ncbi:MAG: hypothetical protein CMH49_07020 [Myxococcales bacterium]|nr:hypothetical protein [Myxococcales bacterium]
MSSQQDSGTYPIKGNRRYTVNEHLLSIPSGELWSAVDIRRGGNVTLFYPDLKEKAPLDEIVEGLGKSVRQNATLRETGFNAIRDVVIDHHKNLFVVVDRPEGRPLSLLLRERKTLDLNTALSIMIQLCELLNRAHEINVFPATLTLNNIILSQRPNGAFRVCLIDLALDRRPFSAWVKSPPYDLLSIPHPALTQERDRRHFSVYLCTDLLHHLIFGVSPEAPTTHDELRTWPSLPTHGKELDHRLEACLHTVLLKGLAIKPSDRFPRVAALQRTLIGLRQLTVISSPAFELLASTQARLGKRDGSFNLSAPKPGVERAVKARQHIHKILEGHDSSLTLEDVLKAEGGSLIL